MLLLQKKPVQNEIDKKVSIEVKIDKSVNEKIIQFNEFKKSIESKKDLVQKDFEDYCITLEKKRISLINEVTDLEQRKIEAQKPLDDKEAELIHIQNALLEDRQEIDSDKALLQEKYADIARMEVAIEKGKAKLDEMTCKLEDKEREVRESIKLLEKEEQKVIKDRNLFDKLIVDKENDIKARYDDLVAKNSALQVLLEENQQKSVGIELKDKILNNKIESLTYATQELEAKTKQEISIEVEKIKQKEKALNVLIAENKKRLEGIEMTEQILAVRQEALNKALENIKNK